MLSTKEIIEKYNLTTLRVDKNTFIAFCKRRGIELVFIEKRNHTNYYDIIKDETQDLPNEAWKQCYDLPDYLISTMGRIKKDGVFYKGVLNNGYLYLNLPNKKKYRIHRLVLNTFQTNINANNLVVDHINGIKTDNRLENLRWATNEENIKLNFENRKPFDKEITRLLEKYGYDKTLQMIKNLV